MSIVRIALSLAAAALCAVAVLAPTEVAAHPQHVHSSQATTVQHAVATGVEQGAIQKKNAAQDLTSAQATPAGAPDNAACIDRGCCSNGACSACCSIVAPVVIVTFPLSDSLVLFGRDGPVRSTVAVEGPSRPPKHFA